MRKRVSKLWFGGGVACGVAVTVVVSAAQAKQYCPSTSSCDDLICGVYSCNCCGTSIEPRCCVRQLGEGNPPQPCTPTCSIQ